MPRARRLTRCDTWCCAPLLLAMACGDGSSTAPPAAESQRAAASYDASSAAQQQSSAAPDASSVAEAQPDAAPPVALPEHPICDGSQALRFGARTFGGEISSVPPIIRSLGFTYLYVLGDCSYWSNSSAIGWGSTRHGTLTPEQERELAQDLGWNTGCDANSAATFSGSGIELYDSCRHTNWKYEAWTKFRAWLLRFDQVGDAVEGGLRVMATQSDVEQPTSEARVWPYSWPPDLLVSEREGPGVSIDGAHANDLRALRAMYARDGVVLAPNGFRRDSLTFYLDEAPQHVYELWFRDRIPLEDEQGEVRFPY
jgi:hypothetical protein